MLTKYLILSVILNTSHIGESDHIILNFNIHTTLQQEENSFNKSHRYKYYKADIDTINDISTSTTKMP